MTSDFSIDDDLLSQAAALGPHGSREATVREALREYVARRNRENLLQLAGTIDFRPDFDYKEARKKR